MHKCARCGKTYKYQSDYDRHVNRKNPCKSSTLFECPDCLNTYATKGSLKRHQDGHCTANQADTDDNQANSEEIADPLVEEDLNDEFKCEHCNKAFTRKFNLERHTASRCTVKKNAETQKATNHAKIMKDIKCIMSRLTGLKSKLEALN